MTPIKICQSKVTCSQRTICSSRSRATPACTDVAKRSAEMTRLGLGTSALTKSQLRAGPPTDFYLAIRKSALEQKWFWSVYLKELQPFGPSPGNARHARRAVPRPERQALRVRRRRSQSDERRVLARPHHRRVPDREQRRVQRAARQRRLRADRSIRRPQSLRRTRRLFGDSTYGAVKLETELSFVQGFRPAADGGSFEQTFTAYADQPIGIPGDVDNNDYRVAATVGVSLRRYTETPSYAEVPAPSNDHYFLADPINVPNTGAVKRLAVALGFPSRHAADQVGHRSRDQRHRRGPVARRRGPLRSDEARHRVVECRVRLHGVHGAARDRRATRSPTITRTT